MVQLGRIIDYLNPFNRLGKRQYSLVFPLSVTLLTAILLEAYYHFIVQVPQLVRTPAVLIFIGLIIYFSFHDGLLGGMTASWITIGYYFYIIISQYTSQEMFINDFEETLAFATLYLALSAVIGGLKQKTDRLLETAESEKNRLQTIIEHMPAGIISVDKAGQVTHANKQLEVISGYKIPKGATLGNDKVLIPETYNIKSSQSFLNQVLKEGEKFMKREFMIRRKDGKDRYIQISASPIVGKDNKITGATAIISDITLQKEHEQRKDDFVNIASHELRTPITSLKLFINSLSFRMKKNNDLQVRKIIKNIDYQTDRLEKLVNDLLDVSRMQTGKMLFSKEPCLLNDLLKETIENLKAVAKKQNIIFLEKNLLNVSVDKFRIQQVITNLITNAIKYSDSYSDIIVQTRKIQNRAIVSVKDTGIGISKEEQKKIFNRLYQVSDSKEKTFPGLGIGLYISKQIITRHKGRIWVESEKGKGSTFYISLPLYKN